MPEFIDQCYVNEEVVCSAYSFPVCIKPEKRVDILKDSGLLGGKDVDITNLSGHAERNGIKYFISSSEMMGIMFGASRK